MKVIILWVSLVFLSAPVASAWAILLNRPELQLLGKQDPEVLKEVNSAMTKLDFKGGVIHVGAPGPNRWLRFGAPGQSLNELLPLLQKLGMKVTLSFSDKMQPDQGFAIFQKEDGSNELGVTIHTKHEKFDLSKLRVKLAPTKP
jgi:hypothetical protein